MRRRLADTRDYPDTLLAHLWRVNKNRQGTHHVLSISYSICKSALSAIMTLRNLCSESTNKRPLPVAIWGVCCYIEWHIQWWHEISWCSKLLWLVVEIKMAYLCTLYYCDREGRLDQIFQFSSGRLNLFEKHFNMNKMYYLNGFDEGVRKGYQSHEIAAIQYAQPNQLTFHSYGNVGNGILALFLIHLHWNIGIFSFMLWRIMTCLWVSILFGVTFKLSDHVCYKFLCMM